MTPPVPTTNGIAARYERFSHSGNTWYDLTPTPADATDSPAIVETITNITNAAVRVVTVTAHGLSELTRVKIEGVSGMTEANAIFTVANVKTDAFQLYDLSGTTPPACAPVDTTGWGTYTGGGTASRGAFEWPAYDGVSWSTIGTPAKLDFPGASTICLWAKTDLLNPPVQGSEVYLSRREGGGNSNFMLIADDPLNQISYFHWVPGFKAAQSPPGLTGVYHYCVAVNEGIGGAQLLYIDGVVTATNATGGGVPGWLASLDWEFARPQNTSMTDYLQGGIDTGRFYNRALSPDEILRDYKAGKPVH